MTAVIGPLPFDRFADTAEASLFPLDGPTSASAGHALVALGALGRGDGAAYRHHERRWREAVDRNGLTWLGAAHALVIANAEIWAGDAEGAERRLHEARDVLAVLGDIGREASAVSRKPDVSLTCQTSLDISSLV